MKRDFWLGYLLGLIVGEGSFTTHGKEPALAMKLHEDDLAPLLELQKRFGGKLYGPYKHGDRRYRTWFLRGRPLLALVPVLRQHMPASKKREQLELWFRTRLCAMPQIEMWHVEHSKKSVVPMEVARRALQKADRRQLPFEG